MAKDVYGSIQKELGDGRKSLGGKYKDIFVGRRGPFAFLKYELLTWLSGFPGALGFTLRKAIYPSLLAEVGKGVIFGRHLTFRHPHKISIGTGAISSTLKADVPCDDVARAGGISIEAVRGMLAKERDKATAAMAAWRL